MGPWPQVASRPPTPACFLPPSPLQICLSAQDMNHSAPPLSPTPHHIFAHHNGIWPPGSARRWWRQAHVFLSSLGPTTPRMHACVFFSTRSILKIFLSYLSCKSFPAGTRSGCFLMVLQSSRRNRRRYCRYHRKCGKKWWPSERRRKKILNCCCRRHIAKWDISPALRWAGKKQLCWGLRGCYRALGLP